MANPNRFSFVVGSVFLAALAVAIVFGAFLLRDAGALRARVTIHVQFEDIAGLRQGAPVRLQGRDVGVVADVRNDPAAPFHRVTLSIVDEPTTRQWLRTDSTFQVMADGLLGNKVVEIARGTRGTPLPGDATVRGASPVSLEGILRDLRTTVKNTAAMSARLDRALGAMDGEGGEGLSRSMVQIQQSLADLSSVTGELRSLFEKDSRDPDSLRATLADLRRASGNAAKLMDELKQGLKDDQGKPRNLGQILTNLEQTAQNTQEVTASVKQMLGAKNGKPADLAKTLQDLEVSAKNLKEITEGTKSMMAGLRKMYPPNWFK